MAEVASRELRDHTRALLDRVAAGETITITVDGRPVARLGPIESRPRWISREEFMRRIVGRQADPGLREDLRELLGNETTAICRFDDSRPGDNCIFTAAAGLHQVT